MEQPEVVMIGLGYIGLPTAALISSNNVKVHGVDINPKVVETINRGEIHIVEPDLDIAVASAVKNGYLLLLYRPLLRVITSQTSLLLRQLQRALCLY